MTFPPVSVLDKAFRYTPSGSTNVQLSWARYGWKPVSEEERLVKVERMKRHAFLADENGTKGDGREPAE